MLGKNYRCERTTGTHVRVGMGGPGGLVILGHKNLLSGCEHEDARHARTGRLGCWRWDLPGPDSVRLVECGDGWRGEAFDSEQVWKRYEWGTDGDARLCIGLLTKLWRELIGVGRPRV
jgi:hypothetical protein